MPIIVEIKENRPGYADLEIKRWKGEGNIEIAIQRNQDQHYFAEGEYWGSEPTWHRLPDLQQNEEGTWTGLLTPVLIDPLVQQTGNTQFLLWVKSGDFTDRGVIKFIGNILASVAGGDSYREQATREVNTLLDPQPEIEVVQAVEDSIAEENIEIEENKAIEDLSVPVAQHSPVDSVVPKKGKGSLIVLILLLLAIISGVLAWLLLGKSTEKASEVSACTYQQGSDEITFLQECLKTNPDTAQVLSIIQSAKQANACSVAQRLYANKGQSGNAEIAFAYAKEYDEAFVQSNVCFKADKEAAIYWYETGLEIDPNNQEAKQRLEELKK